MNTTASNIIYVSNCSLSAGKGKGGNAFGELGTVCTIGSFDGVHLGHRYVMQQVIEQAHSRGLASLVVTFPNHPLKVLRPDFKAQLLTLADEKVELLKQTEVDGIALLEFTRELSQLTSRQFMEKVLKQQLNVKVLVIGYDNHFGHDHKSFDDYVEYGKELGIEVLRNKEYIPQKETSADDKSGELKISSTVIRKALLEGDVSTANNALGYSYYIKGKVVSGFHIGRKIGFPTANIEVDADKLIPMNGAYFVRVEAPQSVFYGMMNIGHRPTLDNGPQRSIEVNLFDCHEDLYDQTLRIEFLHFLRPEHKFSTIDDLVSQLEDDRKQCEAFIGKQ